MTAKPRKEAAEAVRQLQQAMDLTRLRMRPEGAARLVEQVAIRPVADPLAEALELAEDVLSRHPYSAELWPNGIHPQIGIGKIRDALANYRGEGK